MADAPEFDTNFTNLHDEFWTKEGESLTSENEAG
jgi:hypothetical protein